MAKSNRKKKTRPTPSPLVLQRAAKGVLSGNIPLSKHMLNKLKRHRVILRKLAALKGKPQVKKAFVTRHKKQIGGFLPFLPLIAGTLGALIPALANGLKG
jgi:hypothetical protein